jgi:hypothetical protein
MTDLVVVEKLEGWEKLKKLVLDSVSSPITKRVYNMALNEFLAWFQQAPRPGFTKATVSAWRVSLEARGLGSSSIIIRMSAIRKRQRRRRTTDSWPPSLLPASAA